MSSLEHVRTIDPEAIKAAGPEKRYAQKLVGQDMGSETCEVNYIITPPGGGSPDGLHRHEADQHFYILEGVMKIEIDGVVSEVPAGSLVVFPKGVPHRNWNEGSRRTVHLAINTPAPDPSVPFGRPV